MQDIGDKDDTPSSPRSNADPAESIEQPVPPEGMVPHRGNDVESSSGALQHSNETPDPSFPTQVEGSIDPEQEEFLLTMIKFASGNLDMSIECQSQLVALTPDDHKDKPSRLNDLGLWHHQRFQLRGRLEDIELAIEVLSQAASIVPHHSLGEPICFANLGSCYRSRFERYGNTADLSKAIEFQSQAMALSPEENPNKPKTQPAAALSVCDEM